VIVASFQPSRIYALVERRRLGAGAWLSAAARRASALLMSVYKGVWLGLLDRDDLSALTQVAYDEAIGTIGWDAESYLDSGLHRWEASFVERLQPGARVLVACAGAGREAFELMRRGFDVTAFDCCSNLVEAARSHQARLDLPGRFVQSEPDSVPDLGQFDAAIVGWCGYMHIIGRRRRIAFLQAIRAQLGAGSPVLVSALLRREGSRRFALATALANLLRRLRRREPVELGDELRQAGTFAHCFTGAELASEVEAAGLVFESFTEHQQLSVSEGSAIGVAPSGSVAA